MSITQRLGHRLLVLVLFGILVGLPCAAHTEIFRGKSDTDAVSGATMKLPEQPSGEFVILINEGLHRDTLSDWQKFFSGEDLPVIFDDISCLTAEGDLTGILLAERMQAQLPENQMCLRSENPTLLVSKAEAGLIDVAVFSKEMADALKLKSSGQMEGIAVITVKGGD